MLIGAAGTSVVAGGVAMQKFGWDRRSFVRADYSESAPVAPPGEASWMNWSGIERSTPKEIAFPDSVEALAQTVTPRERPRAPGGQRSFLHGPRHD
jgi:hypothetical protein